MKVRLNENYPNDFLTVHTGQIFYRKGNRLGKDENIVEIDSDANPEFKQLLNQQYLIEVKDSIKESKEIPKSKDPEVIPKSGMTTKNLQG